VTPLASVRNPCNEEIMKARLAAIVCVSPLLFASPVHAQDLGPHVRKIEDGIFVYAAKAQDSNVSIISRKKAW